MRRQGKSTISAAVSQYGPGRNKNCPPQKQAASTKPTTKIHEVFVAAGPFHALWNGPGNFKFKLSFCCARVKLDARYSVACILEISRGTRNDLLGQIRRGARRKNKSRIQANSAKFRWIRLEGDRGFTQSRKACRGRTRICRQGNR
jgi:hypothetical protein